VTNTATQRNIRVLLVEDSLPIRQRVRSLIEESGHATIVGEAGTVTAALALFREHHPDAVVLDLHLTEGTGYPVLEEIKQTQPACEVIVLTNFPIPESRERCRTLGADHFFDKAKDFERVPGVLAGVGRAGAHCGRILIADDEVMVGTVLKQFLQGNGYDCEWVPDAAEAIHALSRSRFDLLIADINMPGNRQLELMPELRRVAPGLPVILLTGDPSIGSAAAAVRLDAKAYLSKPPDLAELKSLVQESVANHRVHQAVRRKWEQFQALAQDLNQQLAVPRSGAADAGEFQELEHLFRALNDLVRTGGGGTGPEVMNVVQHLELVGAVRETITVLEKTRRAFKSKQLGQLRERLETLVAGLGLADTAALWCARPDAGGPARVTPAI
jgi:DNA-binding response OmpR family regulator